MGLEEDRARQRRAARAALGGTGAGGPQLIDYDSTPGVGQAPVPEAAVDALVGAPPVEGRAVAGTPGDADRPQEGLQTSESLSRMSQGPNGERVLHLDNGGQGRTVVLRDPNNFAADMTRAGVPELVQNQMAQQLRVDPAAPAARGLPAGNHSSMTVTASADAPVRPETAAAAQAAAEAESAAQVAAQRQEVMRAELVGRQAHEIADIVQRQAVVEEEDIEERTTRVNERMSQFDDAIDRVSNNRVDPEAFFGGNFSRRLGAGVLVAIGGIGSAIGGGPNQAAATIEGMIDRNIRAQESNQANDRAAAGLEGQSLGMFRAMLGDEEAARSANRASHLGAAEARVRAMMATAAPDQIESLQVLGNALQESRRAAEQIARDRGRHHIEHSVSVRQASRPSTAARAAARLLESTLSPEERQVRTRRTGRSAARRHVISRGGPAAATVRRRSNNVTAAHLELLTEQLADRRARGTAAGVPNFRAGGLFEQDDELLANATRDEGSRRDVREQVSSATHMNRALDQIEAYRSGRSEWGALTHDDQRAMGRAWYAALRDGYRVQYGIDSVSGPAELEFLNELAGEPLDAAMSDFLSRNHAEAFLRSQRAEINARAQTNLEPFGLTIRTDRRQIQGPGQHRVAPPEGTVPENRTVPVEERGVSNEAADMLIPDVTSESAQARRDRNVSAARSVYRAGFRALTGRD